MPLRKCTWVILVLVLAVLWLTMLAISLPEIA